MKISSLNPEFLKVHVWGGKSNEDGTVILLEDQEVVNTMSVTVPDALKPTIDPCSHLTKGLVHSPVSPGHPPPPPKTHIYQATPPDSYKRLEEPLP